MDIDFLGGLRSLERGENIKPLTNDRTIYKILV
jgi:hypothetical protein